jgi:hypothetical protein
LGHESDLLTMADVLQFHHAQGSTSGMRALHASTPRI